MIEVQINIYQNLILLCKAHTGTAPSIFFNKFSKISRNYPTNSKNSGNYTIYNYTSVMKELSKKQMCIQNPVRHLRWNSKPPSQIFGRVLNTSLNDLNGILLEYHLKLAPNPVKTIKRNAVYKNTVMI